MSEARPWASMEIVESYGDDKLIRAKALVTPSSELVAAYTNLDNGNKQLEMTCYVAHRRRLFTTDRLRIGLGTCDTRVRDHIAIIHGSPTPLILWKGAVREHYTFVGACYYEGAMLGEEVTWAEDEADGIELR